MQLRALKLSMILLTTLTLDAFKVNIVLVLIINGEVVLRFYGALAYDPHEVILVEVHDQGVLCCYEVEVYVPRAVDKGTTEQHWKVVGFGIYPYGLDCGAVQQCPAYFLIFQTHLSSSENEDTVSFALMRDEVLAGVVNPTFEVAGQIS